MPRKIIILFLITVFGFSVLFSPAPARGQAAVAVVANPFETAVNIAKEALLAAGQAALSNALDYAARKMAYDTAMFIATGGKGQGAMAWNMNFGKYLEDVGSDVAGVAMESFARTAVGSAFGEGAANGLNICNIPDLKVDLALKLSYSFKYGSEPPKPRCNFKQFADNWTGEGFKSRFSEPGSVEKMFNASLEAEDSNDFGIALKTQETIDRRIYEQIQSKTLERTEGGGYKAVEDLISGVIKTPAANVKDTAVAGTSPIRAEDKNQEKANAATASGEVSTIIATYASIFIDTLAGQIYKNYKECGILAGVCPGASNFSPNEGGTGYRRAGTGAAATAFGKLLVSPIRQLDQYDVLNKYSSCSNPQNPGPEECIIDQKMVAALQQSAQGNLLTIKDAVDRGILDGTKKLISPVNVLSYDANYCWTQGYCLSNVKKMRKARILPLGFEIAVEKSDPDKPWTLADVINGYNDPAKPYYHLVDPNWVLKIPEARCNAMGYGTTLNPSISSRAEECVNLTSCVGYTKDGTCRDYAYCAREKNVWKFDADACDSYYQTCRSFMDSRGSKVNYLYRTLNTKNCNQTNAGCLPYSLSKLNGSWQAPANDNTSLYNKGVFLNEKLSTSCSGKSDGCTAYRPADTATDNTYVLLRQAPDYLNCYDRDLATAGVQRPATRAELARLQPKAECSNYAKICLPEEVDCSWYTPITYIGSKIPGKFRPAEVNAVNNTITNWNDQCDAKCVGYSSYREMESNYANGADIAYIIPSSGRACAAEEEGCSSFTNMSTTVGGMEKTEYFAYLRPCINPDPAKQKNYLTYEGSVVGGFQLKSYTLVKDDSNTPDLDGKTGGPKYFYRAPEDFANYSSQCTKALYQDGLASTDCREFNDEQGNIYYRLLSKTIAVSDSCTPYRLNTAEMYVDSRITQANCVEPYGLWKDNQCNVCFQNGEYRGGFCFYSGLPSGTQNTAGVSRSCSANADTCRAYKGNAGNNVRNIFNDTFEGDSATALSGWTAPTNGEAVSQTTESTRAGEHSLGYSGSNGFYKTVTLTPGKSYDLTFWMKGEPQDMTVSLAGTDGAVIKDFATITLSDVWRSYHLGPLELSGTSQVRLLFRPNGTKRSYLDNVELKETVDNIYLVKNTLEVDPICDSNPNDNLPGEALGCAEYRDQNNTAFYLTNFSYLCRTEAVGCTALIDTKNTLDTDKPKAYNVWFAGSAGTEVTKTFGAGNTVSCRVPMGETGCYANVMGVEATAITAVAGVLSFNNSTIYIEGDTPSTAPLYLVAERAASCNQVDLGCVLAGAETELPDGSKQYATTTIKNDPALYDGSDAILCTGEASGCERYSSDKGESYFKDPIATGQKICQFSPNVSINGRNYSGWFWKDVGKCGGNGEYCSADADCNGATCADKGKQPCYENYLVNGSMYELYSLGDTGQYQNFVGECPAEQNNCTEYVDHADNNAKYYYLANQRINSGDCAGQVSQKYGCILLDRTENPNKYYKTADTYRASESARSEKVDPVKAETAGVGGENDANEIIKVQRDRVCGEWLKCEDSHPVYDEKLGKWTTVCDTIGRCNKLPETTDEMNAKECADTVDGTGWISGDSEFAGEILNDTIYSARRDINWKGMDFSGYSVLGMYPLEELEQVDLSSDSANPRWSLVKRIPCGGSNDDGNAVDRSVCADSDDMATACKAKVVVRTRSVSTDGSPCGLLGDAGICLNGECVRGPDGQKEEDKLLAEAPSHACRAYPEKDSPFPNTLAVWDVAQNYNNVPVCSGRDKMEDPVSDVDSPVAKACECDYSKATYSTGNIKYFGLSAQAGNLPQWICFGGSKDGADCGAKESSDWNTCVDGGGSCLARSKFSQFVGWRGFCLEEDLAKSLDGSDQKHPCLTWYPVDQLIGAPDLNNMHTEAGFEPPTGYEPFYCVRPNAYRVGLPNDFNMDILSQIGGVDVAGGIGHVSCDSLNNRTTQLLISAVPMIGGGLLSGAIMSCVGLCSASVCPDLSGAGYPVVSPEPQYDTNDLFNPDKERLHCWCEYIRDQNVNSGSTLAVPREMSPHIQGESIRTGCDTVVQVASNEGESKPRTNAMWKNRISELIFPTINVEYGGSPPAYRQPFGFANNPRTATTPVLWTPFCVANDTYTLPHSNDVTCLKKPPSLEGDWPGSLTEWGGSEDVKGGRPYGRLYLESQHIQNAGGVETCPTGGTWNGTGCIDSANTGVQNLKTLFAKIYSAYKSEPWSSPPYRGETFDNLGITETDWSSSADLARDAPTVSAVGECLRGDKCVEGAPNNLTVNGVSTGVVDIPRGRNASLKFFAFADDDHMPLKRLKINWGDDSKEREYSGSFRNHRGLVNGTCDVGAGKCKFAWHRGASRGYVTTAVSCDDDNDCRNIERCVPLAPGEGFFGYVAGQTCDNAYFRFDHYYKCVEGQTTPADSWHDNCKVDFPNSNITGGCCAYTPKVQVLDNWGWCNGTNCGPDSSPGGVGCYDEECDGFYPTAYTSFGGGTGKVLVPPTE